MKKTYIQPVIAVTRIQTVSMIAVSTHSQSLSGAAEYDSGTHGELGSRNIDIWGDDDE